MSKNEILIQAHLSGMMNGKGEHAMASIIGKVSCDAVHITGNKRGGWLHACNSSASRALKIK